MNPYNIEFYNGVITEIKQPVIEGESNFNEQSFPNYVVQFKDKYKNTTSTELYSHGFKFDVGEKVYVSRYSDRSQEYYSLGDKLRQLEIYGSILLFIVIVLSIFGLKGLKALGSLIISFFVIFYLLIPGILNGYNPVLISAGIASSLLAISMLITHGRTAVSYSAILGSSISIVITVAMSYFIVIYSKISGYVDEGSFYIQSGFDGTSSHINLSFLIIASIIIGVVGAVDDGAITQAGIVKEIKSLNKNISQYECYKRAMNIGRAHGGAMINTLILAYVAGAIPNLLFIYKSQVPLLVQMNSEQIAIEIFRSVISSIGLLLAIPLTTLFAVYLVKGDEVHAHHQH